jgi:hypothetical protein
MNACKRATTSAMFARRAPLTGPGRLRPGEGGVAEQGNGLPAQTDQVEAVQPAVENWEQREERGRGAGEREGDGDRKREREIGRGGLGGEGRGRGRERAGGGE